MVDKWPKVAVRTVVLSRGTRRLTPGAFAVGMGVAAGPVGGVV
jgi:hypothetical protein